MGRDGKLTDGFHVAYMDVGKEREQERQALLYPSYPVINGKLLL